MATVSVSVYGLCDERVLSLPAHRVVCGRCEGEGSILNPSIGEHAYSQEEFDEAFPDEECGGYNPREEYRRRGGMYDVACPACKGRNVVDELDREALRGGSVAKQRLLARIEGAEQADAEYEAECRMERAMGC